MSSMYGGLNMALAGLLGGSVWVFGAILGALFLGAVIRLRDQHK